MNNTEPFELCLKHWAILYEQDIRDGRALNVYRAKAWLHCAQDLKKAIADYKDQFGQNRFIVDR